MSSLQKNPHEDLFVGREAELKRLTTHLNEPRPLINIYGEAGIGKTSLLQATSRHLEEHESALVIVVDLEEIKPPNIERPRAVLREFISQSKDMLSGEWVQVDIVARRIVDQLNALAFERTVAIFFDTTEVLHQDRDFWTWIEKKIVGPLLVEQRVSLVFSGRVPVPWRRIEVRRKLQLMPLKPLMPPPAEQLVMETLKDAAWFNDATDSARDLAVDLILMISCQHPGLMRALADEIKTAPWPPDDIEQHKRYLCESIVKPFIDDELFKSIPEHEQEWKRILWWLSIWDWFNVTIVVEYLNHVDQALAEGREDFYFIAGLSRLRTQHTVVFQVEPEGGDRLHGTIRDIVRTCFRITEPDNYKHACISAAETLEALRDKYLQGDTENQRIFGIEADKYRRYAEEAAP